MKTFFLVALTTALLCSSVTSQCIPGLQFFNRTNHNLLPGCNDVVDIKSLAEQPTVAFNNPKFNDSYLLMLLETHPNNHDLFILHWLLADIKPFGQTLQTRIGVRDLGLGYFALVNQTQYEFRLYNMTGKQIFDTVNAVERFYFLPSQWLAKNTIHSPPLAKTIFTAKAFIPGPPGWVVSQPPVNHPQPPQYPPQQPLQPSGHPNQHLPNYPTQSPPYPQLPAPQHPGQPSYPQQPVLPAGQPLPPVYSVHPMQPAYPNQIITQPPHPPYPNQPNTGFNQPPSTFHSVRSEYNINGTIYRVLSNNIAPHNILNINSTMYTSNTYNKRFRLTPYLIIDNKSYIWYNYTHNPSKGPSVFINGTQYVPFTPPKEIHHYHYHKGAATSLNPTTLLFTLIIPIFLCFYHS